MSAESQRRPAPYRPLVAVAAAACAGVACDRHCGTWVAPHTVGVWWFSALAALTAAWMAHRFGRARAALVLLLCAVACNGAAWSRIRWSWFAADDIGRFASEAAEPACIEAVLQDTPKVAPPPPRDPLRPTPLGAMSEANIRIVAIRDGRRWRSASGKAQLRVVGEWLDVKPGDQIRVFARLSRPLPTLNPGQYDWGGAERSERRLCRLYCADLECIEVVDAAQPNRMTRALGQLRRWSRRQIAANVNWGDAKLPLAVLLGAREQLPDETTEAFMHTGTIHLLVVSGLHVGMVAGVVWWIGSLASLSLRLRAVATVAVVLAYAAIVGASSPVIRATVLVVLLLCALASGRRTTPLNLLAAALLVVVAYNPAELVRSGTQLSFLSVAALMVFGRWAQRRRRVDPLKRLLAESAPWPHQLLRRAASSLTLISVASLIVWLTTFPLVAYHFHIATPIGVLISPVLWPLVAIALAAGIGVATIGWLAPPVAAACGALCGGGLNLTQRVVEWADSSGLGYFHTAGPQWWWVCGWYAGVGLFSFVPALRPSKRVLVGLACLWTAASLASDGWRQSRGDDQLHCTFLAMGHGACAVLELPGNQTVLYDAGSLGSPAGAARTISSFLWSRRIDHIDALVISHADIDHYNAVPRLLELMPIHMVYVSPMMFDPFATDGELTAPNYLRDVLREHGVPMREIWMGDRLRARADDVDMEVLHPSRKGVIGRDNANSILLCVSYAGRRILLPGDLEPPGLDAVISDPPYDCDVLLAPHHGSASSDPPGFAAWSTPEWVVLSGGQRSGTSAASDSYQSAGAQVLHTAEVGAVGIRVSEKGIKVATFRQDSQANKR